MLLGPLKEFLSRPAKGFRGQFVELGYLLGGEPIGLDEIARGLCERAAGVLETLHAASLVVDDIEDNSLMRRGSESLHVQLGIPRALNAGNWLYFWPLEDIRNWGLPAERELTLYRVCHEALLRAHFGQALDVSIPITSQPQEKIAEVVKASLELKTGALMALALELGAALRGAPAERRGRLGKFGREFGVSLQMFDDIGNLGLGRVERDPKQFEDLKLLRPSRLGFGRSRRPTPGSRPPSPELCEATQETSRRSISSGCFPRKPGLLRWRGRGRRFISGTRLMS